MNELVKIAGSRGLKVSAEPVPTAVETLEHLEQTLDNLDPVVVDKAADAVIAEITGGAVPEGTFEHGPGASIADPSIGHP